MEIIEPLAMANLALDAGLHFGSTAAFLATIGLLLSAFVTVVLARDVTALPSA